VRTFKPLLFVHFLLILVLFYPGAVAAADPSPSDEAIIAAYSDPARVWGNGVERVIEEAYRLCFRTRILGGKVMNLRMPFAQNYERDKLTDEEWGFIEGGKGNPAFLWEKINEVLDSGGFRLYAETLADGREKVVIFDLPHQEWTYSRDLFDIARMKAGSYRGLPHRPYVLVSGRGLEETDVYNYLYCIGLTGMDCSGFVWHVLSYIASQDGVDLGRTLARLLGVKQGENPSWYAGADFYNSKSSQIIAVDDEIAALRPGDVLLFRGEDGGMAHSAIVQSVDLAAGVVRYLQCTDEAPLGERGVHDSYIRFDPTKPRTSLKDLSLNWTQARYPPFPGEKASPFSDDGKRFRAYPEHGGGRVVRLRAVSAVIEKIEKRR
jgi:hypothetical protein